MKIPEIARHLMQEFHKSEIGSIDDATVVRENGKLHISATGTFLGIPRRIMVGIDELENAYVLGTQNPFDIAFMSVFRPELESIIRDRKIHMVISSDGGS
jgi:hypothetical protein